MIRRVNTDAHKDRRRLSVYAETTRPERFIVPMTVDQSMAEMNAPTGMEKLNDCFLNRSIDNSSFDVDRDSINRIVYNGDSSSIGKFTSEGK